MKYLTILFATLSILTASAYSVVAGVCWVNDNMLPAVTADEGSNDRNQLEGSLSINSQAFKSGLAKNASTVGPNQSVQEVLDSFAIDRSAHWSLINRPTSYLTDQSSLPGTVNWVNEATPPEVWIGSDSVVLPSFAIVDSGLAARHGNGKPLFSSSKDWQSAKEQARAVPEPLTIICLALGFCLMATRRHRHPRH